MFLPEYLNIGVGRISTLLLIAILGVLYWCFVLWYESRKDGFDSDRMFDITFLSIFFGGLTFYLFSRLISWLEIYRPNNVLLNVDRELFLTMLTALCSLAPVLIVSKKWKWSVYRLLDIYSLAFSLLIVFLGLGKFFIFGQFAYLSLTVFVIIIYFLVLRFRGYKLASGIMFSVFMFFSVFSGFLLFRRNGYLLFYPILFTIGLVNLYLRRKRSMSKTTLPKEFIDRVSRILKKKDQELKQNQQQLIDSDPYMQEGRTVGNSEIMDEAVLEDAEKHISDARLDMLGRVRLQIRRALAAIKIGKYGVCEKCGDKIDTARLNVYPEATLCINCAEDKHQEETN